MAMPQLRPGALYVCVSDQNCIYFSRRGSVDSGPTSRTASRIMAKRQAEAKAAQEADKENPPPPPPPKATDTPATDADSGEAEAIFEENELVLARDGGRLYDAKVRQ
jgi:hypothetical protein